MRTWWYLLAGLAYVCLLAAGRVVADPIDRALTPGEYALEWVPDPSGEAMPAPSAVAMAALSPARPAAVSGGPADGASCRWGALPIGPGGRKFAVVFEESLGKWKGLDTLWADTDGDGDLADETRVKGRVVPGERGCTWRSRATLTFRCKVGEAECAMPVVVTLTRLEDGRPAAQYRVLGFWRAEVPTDKAPLLLTFQDPAGQGCCDRRWDSARTAALACTIGFSEPERPRVWIDEQHLAEAQLVGGRLYRFGFSPAGDRLVVGPYQGESGKVRVVVQPPPSGAVLKAARIWLTGSNGLYLAGGDSVTAPAGVCTALDATATLTDGEFERSYSFRANREARVVANETAEVKVGGALRLELLGTGPEPHPQFRRGAKGWVAFEVVDAAGNVLRGARGPGSTSPFAGAVYTRAGKRILLPPFGFG